MKLLRYGPVGEEKPGLLDDNGHIRDLSGLIDDITPRTLAPASLEGLRAIDPKRLPRVEVDGEREFNLRRRVATGYRRRG